MESDAEALRLDLKTDAQKLKEQAIWAGIKPGMRVADIGCGSGKTTFYLHKLTQPNGSTFGIDGSSQRLEYAGHHYSADGLEYINRNFCMPLDDLGSFDFIWMRFILEYFRSQSFDIVKNVANILKPGGILCLIDLDCNCLRHFGFSQRLQQSISGVMTTLETNANFDPYAGVKLYSYLYDLNFEAIDVMVAPHNLTFGDLKETDAFNWAHKLEFAAKNSGYAFDEYRNGFEGFSEEFRREFADPRRFHYSPLIACRGEKPPA
jgi:ubiquinone/menaquinone biosynthesis C-methylase UbiE